MSDLAKHILAMADDAHFVMHPEWAEIVKEAEHELALARGEDGYQALEHDMLMAALRGLNLPIAAEERRVFVDELNFRLKEREEGTEA